MLGLRSSNQQRQALTQNPTTSLLQYTHLWRQSNRTGGDARSAMETFLSKSSSLLLSVNLKLDFSLLSNVLSFLKVLKRFRSFSKLVNKKWLYFCAAVLYLVTQSRPTLCNPMDPPGSSVYGISQARILEWVPFPSPGDLPDPEIEPASPAWQADSLLLSHQWSPKNNIWKIIRWATYCWVRRMVLKHLGNLYKAFCC